MGVSRGRRAYGPRTADIPAPGDVSPILDEPPKSWPLVLYDWEPDPPPPPQSDGKLPVQEPTGQSHLDFTNQDIYATEQLVDRHKEVMEAQAVVLASQREDIVELEKSVEDKDQVIEDHCRHIAELKRGVKYIHRKMAAQNKGVRRSNEYIAELEAAVAEKDKVIERQKASGAKDAERVMAVEKYVARLKRGIAAKDEAFQRRGRNIKAYVLRETFWEKQIDDFVMDAKNADEYIAYLEAVKADFDGTKTERQGQVEQEEIAGLEGQRRDEVRKTLPDEHVLGKYVAMSKADRMKLEDKGHIEDTGKKITPLKENMKKLEGGQIESQAKENAEKDRIIADDKKHITCLGTKTALLKEVKELAEERERCKDQLIADFEEGLAEIETDGDIEQEDKYDQLAKDFDACFAELEVLRAEKEEREKTLKDTAAMLTSRTGTQTEADGTIVRVFDLFKSMEETIERQQRQLEGKDELEKELQMKKLMAASQSQIVKERVRLTDKLTEHCKSLEKQIELQKMELEEKAMLLRMEAVKATIIETNATGYNGEAIKLSGPGKRRLNDFIARLEKEVDELRAQKKRDKLSKANDVRATIVQTNSTANNGEAMHLSGPAGQRLKDFISKLEKEVGALRADKEDIEKTLNSFVQQKDMIDSLEQTIRSKDKELEVSTLLQEDLDCALESLVKQKEKIDSLEEAVRDQHVKMASCAENYDGYVELLEKYDLTNAQLREAREGHEKCFKEITVQKEKISSLEGIARIKDVDFKSLEEKIKKQDAEMFELHKYPDEVDERDGDVEKQLADANEYTQQAYKNAMRLEDLVKEKDSRIGDLEWEVKDKQRMIDESKDFENLARVASVYEKCKADHNDVRVKNEGLEHVLRDKNAEIADQAEKIAGAERFKTLAFGKMKESKEQIAALNRSIEAYVHLLHSKDKEIASRGEKITEMERLMTVGNGQIDALKGVVEASMEFVQTKDQKIAARGEKITVLEGLMAADKEDLKNANIVVTVMKQMWNEHGWKREKYQELEKKVAALLVEVQLKNEQLLVKEGELKELAAENRRREDRAVGLERLMRRKEECMEGAVRKMRALEMAEERIARRTHMTRDD